MNFFVFFLLLGRPVGFRERTLMTVCFIWLTATAGARCDMVCTGAARWATYLLAADETADTAELTLGR